MIFLEERLLEEILVRKNIGLPKEFREESLEKFPEEIQEEFPRTSDKVCAETKKNPRNITTRIAEEIFVRTSGENSMKPTKELV